MNHWLAIVAAILVASPLMAAEPAPAAPASDAPAAATPLLDFARWCAGNDAQSAGILALQQAIAIAPDAAGLQDIGARLAGAGDAASDAPAVNEKRAAADNATAAALAEILNRRAGEAELEPLKRLYVAAITLDTAEQQSFSAIEAALKSRKLLAAWSAGAVRDLIRLHRNQAAAAYLVRLAALDPAGFNAGDYAAATSQPGQSFFIVRSKTHPLVAIVSIPVRWNPAKKTPLMVCCEGAGNNFRHVVDLFHAAVNNGPYIIVTPITFSNTNAVTTEKYKEFYPADIVAPFVGKEDDVDKRLPFDLAGTIAIIQTIHDQFNTEDQIYLFGFSGGGIPCYALLMARPDLIAAAAPTCANFENIPKGTGKSNGAPVQQFFGADDPFNLKIENDPGLMPEGAQAVPMLNDAGYHVLPLIKVPGKEHDPCVDQVHAFFKQVRQDRDKQAHP